MCARTAHEQNQELQMLNKRSYKVIRLESIEEVFSSNVNNR